MANKPKTDDTTDAAPEGVTTLKDVKHPGDPTPEKVESVTLTGPGGTKLTVPKRSADRLKGMGYK